jgi:hypothetical protein
MRKTSIHTHCGIALFLIVNLALAVSHGTARAQEQTGGVPGEWLSRYMSARTAGLGGAFVALANEPTGVVWNPAGLSFMSQNEVEFETSRVFESTAIHGLSFAMPGRRFPSFGLTILNLRSGDFEKTSELNESLGEFNEGDMAFYFSASKHFAHRFSIGTNVKVVRQSLDEFDGAGVGFDLGVLFNVTPRLRFGASVLNIGGPNLTMRDTEETFPVEFRGGLTFHLFNGRGLMSAEFAHRQDGPGSTFRGGAEFWVVQKMALRVGYAYDNPAGGFSLRAGEGWRIDYSANDHELGVVHRFGVSYRFGGFFASSQAVPSVFSPIGENSITKFNLKAKTKAEASTWTLDIVDKSSQLVRSFSGKGVPPAHVMWDGKDETGLPLPDGVYRYSLVVVDEEGREFVAHERSVEISTSGPKGAVPVYTK